MDPKTQQHMDQEQALARERERQAARERVAHGERPWEEQPGVLAVVEAVRDLRFPCGVEELAQRAGDRGVPVREGVQVPLADVLGKLKGDRYFGSLKDFQTAVQRHWEGIRHLAGEQAQAGAGA